MSIKTEHRTDSAERHTRFDVSNVPLSRIRRTPQGFLVIPANFTRTGVLEYKRADGTTVKELRHPDEVFSAESIDSLSSAPVTEFHQGAITPENVADHQAGFVRGDARVSGKFLTGELIVQRKDAIAKVNARELVELSPGYACGIDPTPGVYEGERYDQKQIGIIYNHVALLPKGFGRSGSEVALRMDSAYSEIKEEAQKSVSKEIKKMPITVRRDNVDYQIEIADALAPSFQSALARQDAERSEALDRVSVLEGKLAAEEATKADLQARLDDATDPRVLEERVKTRSSLIVQAQKVYPEIKCDGKSDEEIQKEALIKSGFPAERLDGKDSGFLSGVFETIASREAGAAPASFPKAVGPMMQQDSADAPAERTAAQAHTEMIARQDSAWQQKTN